MTLETLNPKQLHTDMSGMGGMGAMGAGGMMGGMSGPMGGMGGNPMQAGMGGCVVRIMSHLSFSSVHSSLDVAFFLGMRIG